MKVEKEGRGLFYCSSCGKTYERMLAYSPEMVQSFNDRGELVHASTGIILQNKKNEVLLFMRKRYPFLYTIPAGHVEAGEDPKAAALRETFEEIGCALPDAELLFEGEIRGDGCVGGADIHFWHVYTAHTNEESFVLNEEGSSLGWFDLQHLPDDMTYPVMFFFEREDIRKRLLKSF